MSLKSSFIRLPLALACASLLVACGSSPEKNPKLESARAAYQQARANDAVMATPQAQVPLQEASDLLMQAEKSDKIADVEHYAQMAEKKASIAMDVAQRKAAESQAETLNKESKELQLRSREIEIDAKARDAEMARDQAEKARALAEAKTQEAEARAREAELAKEQAEREAEKVRQLQKQLAELQGKQTERGLVLTLGDVLFASGKANLMPGAMSSIDKLAQFLRENPERKVVIEGHTDSVGGDDYNMELSRNRAYSVRNELLGRGVESSRLESTGFGESKPIADNSSAGGRQQNRRVEIIILN